MIKLRVLSGKEVCAILKKAGFEEVRRRGSHIVMQKKNPQGTITVPVPDHNEVRSGTLQSIIRQSGLPAVSLSPIEIEDPMVSTPLKCQQEREEKLEITINEPQSALSIRHILVPYIIAWTGSLNAFGLEYQRQRWATVVVHLCVEFRFRRLQQH